MSGYVARCANCGALVVHAVGTHRPLHRHAKSKKCRIAGARKRHQEKEFKKS